MLGRLNTTYKLALLYTGYKKPLKPETIKYTIIYRKIQSKGTSRLGKVGSVSCHSNYATVNLDKVALYKLLSTKRII